MASRRLAELLARPECAWITRGLEQKAQGYAIANVVPEHIAEVRDRRLQWIEKTRAAVKDRLTKEITYWDHRAEQLKLQEQAGKAGRAPQLAGGATRADDLQARLQTALGGTGLESTDLGAAARGARRAGGRASWADRKRWLGDQCRIGEQSADTQAAAARARASRDGDRARLGFEPTDREFEKLGYDIESRVPGTGRLRFIEVKGRVDRRRRRSR